MAISIKKLNFLPLLLVLLSPVAKGQSTGDYRSAASGDWDNANTWQRYNGSAWVTQGTPTSASGAITVLASHIVTVAANVTVDQVTISSGGQVTVNSGRILTIANLPSTFIVNGTVKNSGTISSAATRLIFNTGSVYQHNYTTTAGTIPTATWNDGSTCEIIGYTSNTSTPGGLGQSFYNFAWNCISQSANLNLTGSLIIRGNLNIQSTGSSNLQLAGGNSTITVNGNYIQTGGNLVIAAQNNTRTKSLNIARNFEISGGTLQKTTGIANISFNGTSTQTFTKTGGVISGDVNFTVNANAIVDFGTSVLNGSTGTFILSNNASIITSHSNGLSATGAIQTTTRTFNSGASYEFKGASTGSFTTTTAGTIKNLTINSTGTTLTQSFTVTGVLSLSNGILTLGNNSLTLGAAGSVTGASASSYIKTDNTGQFKATVNGTATTFPVGNSSYNPITFTNTGTTDIYGIRVIDGAVPNPINNNTQAVNRRWVVTENVLGGSNLTVSPQYNIGETGTNFNAGLSPYIGFYNGSTWIQNEANQTGSNPYTFTSSATFSPSNLTSGTQYFALGKDNAFTAATKLAITSITPNPAITGTAFSVTVQAQDANNVGSSVSSNTSFSLSKSEANGTISGTLSGTILAGTSSVTLNNVTISTPQTTTLTATRTAGANLTAASTSLNVLSIPPTVQASNLTFSAATGTSITINWTAGNGTNSLVLVREGGDVNGNPVNGTSYTASSIFTSAPQIGTGNRVVFNGTGTNVTVTNLTAGTEYFVAIYTFNGPGNMPNYLIESPATGNQRALSSNDYRSKASGDWGALSTWERWNGNSWAQPTGTEGVPSNTDGFVTIQTGHMVYSTITRTFSANKLTVKGTYEHRVNGGTVPTATWEDGSTCLITGVTTTNPAGGLGQNFYNFTWDCVQTGNINLNITSLTTRGNFTLANSSTFTLSLETNNNSTLNIGNNYIQTGGSFNVVTGNGDTGTINITGDFIHTGGTLTVGGDASTNAQIIFNKTGNQLFTASNNTIGSKVDFTVNNSSILNVGTSILTGRNFTLSSGAGLITAHTEGIASTGNTGSIRVSGTRSFSTSANYTYNGNTAQQTGNGLPASVNNLTIDNAADLTLSSNCTVNGNLLLNKGIFNVSNQTLTLNTDIVKGQGSLASAASGTVIYNQQSPGQTVIAGNYGNLTLSNYNKVFEGTTHIGDGSLATENIIISGTFNPGSATHDLGQSSITFNGSSAQNIPASLNYYSLNLIGSGTKTVTASAPSEFKINWNLNLRAPVAFSNITSIHIAKNIWGDQPLTVGTIPVTIGDDWKNTASGYTIQGLVTYSGENDIVAEIGALNYKDLTITASRGSEFPVTTSLVRGPVTISGLLTVNSDCEFATNDNLTLLASENSNANIAPLLDGAQITGNVKVQSFLKGGSSELRGTRSMSSPVNSGNIYEQLKSFIIVTGATGIAGGFDLGGSAAPNAVTITNYKESNLPNKSAFEPIQTLFDEANPPGQGFMIFYRGNRTNAANKLNAPFIAPENTTVVYTGPINQGNIDVNVPNSNHPNDAYNGFLLAGNPYPSTIDWNKVHENSTGLSPNIIIVKAGQPAATYNAALGVSANNGSRYIQPGQGFYVSSLTGGGTLSFREDAKAVLPENIPARLLSRPSETLINNKLSDATQTSSASLNTEESSNLKIIRMNLESATGREEALLGFRNDFSETADMNDARYFGGGSVSLSSLTADNIPVAINTMPDMSAVKEIKLSVNASANGSVKLNFTDLPASNQFNLLLQDNHLNKIVNLKSDPRYEFAINKSISGTYGTERLKLIIAPITTLPVKLESFIAKKVSNAVALTWLTSKEEGNEYFEIERSIDGNNFRVLGKVNGAGNSSSNKQYSFVDTQPESGLNYYRLKQEDQNGNISYSQIAPVKFSTLEDAISVYPNPVSELINVSLNSTQDNIIKLAIYDLQGRELLRSKGNSLLVKSLPAGTYLIQVNDEQNQIITTKKFIKE